MANHRTEFDPDGDDDTPLDPAEVARHFASEVSEVAEAALADFQKHFAASVRPDTELVKKMFDVARGEITEPAASDTTSVRLPRTLHDMASEVVDAGWASSITDLVSTGLRTGLVLLATSAAELHYLDDAHDALASHYREHPDAEPTLALFVATEAQLQGHPAAEHPDLIQTAIEDLGEGAPVEDVLAWIKGALHSGTTARA